VVRFGKDGKGGDDRLDRRMKKLCAKAGLAKWPQNALRHSCASYLFGLNPDKDYITSQLGNSADVFDEHYKGLRVSLAKPTSAPLRF
jgi:hypothetical protein